MRRFLPSAFILFISVPTAWSKAVVYETTFDPGNLFIGREKVDHREYGIPSRVAHAHVLRATYSFPENVPGKALARTLPPRNSCNQYLCTPLPAAETAELTFRDPAMKVTWELLDGRTGKTIAVKSAPFTLTFKKHGELGERLDFVGRTRPHDGALDLPGKVDFTFFRTDRGHEVKVNFPEGLSQYDFELNTYDLASEDGENYVLKGVRFDRTRLARPNHFHGPSLDLDWGFYRHFFHAGAPGSEDPGIKAECTSL